MHEKAHSGNGEGMCRTLILLLVNKNDMLKRALVIAIVRNATT